MTSRALPFAFALLLVLRAPAAGAQAATVSAVAVSPAAVSRGHVRVSLPVAARDLARGDTIREADIAIVDTTIVWRWSGAPADTARAIAGWVTRRAITAGEALRAPAVMAPPMVTSGQSVKVIYQDGPVRLVLTSIATNTAPLGAPVGVRIDRTRRLDGIAVAPNTVRLR